MPSFIFWGERESPCECRPTCKPTQKRYFHLYGDYLLLPLLKTTPMNTRFFSLSPLYRFCRKYMVVLLFLGLAAIPSTTRAQWSVGGKAGINWSTVRYPKNILNDKASFIVGSQAGAVITYTCNTCFDLQLELLYATHGYKDKTLIFNDERGDTMYKGYSYRIHYIDIPLLVKFFPVAGFNIQAGPQLSIGCAATDSWKGVEAFQQPAGAELGVVAGLGYEFDSGLFVDARYTWGLTHSIRDAESAFESRHIGISVGYRFFL